MSNIRYAWERRQGGVRPSYILRRYNDEKMYEYPNIVGKIWMSSPKRKRWCVELVGNYETHILGHLDRMEYKEALDAAKVLILGNLP